MSTLQNIDIYKEVEVTKPTLEEIKEIIRNSSAENEDFSADCIEDVCVDTWVLSVFSYKILFTVTALKSTPNLCEVHIAISRKDIRLTRLLILLMMDWILNKKKEYQFTGIVTSCNTKAMENLANNLGFRKFYSNEVISYFIYTVNTNVKEAQI